MNLDLILLFLLNNPLSKNESKFTSYLFIINFSVYSSEKRRETNKMLIEYSTIYWLDGERDELLWRILSIFFVIKLISWSKFIIFIIYSWDYPLSLSVKARKSFDELSF